MSPSKVFQDVQEYEQLFAKNHITSTGLKPISQGNHHKFLSQKAVIEGSP